MLDAAEHELLALVADVSEPRVRRPEQGQDNSVAIVDERWVVRLARSEDAIAAHANEVATLGLLSGHVPRLLAHRDGGTVYELIPGEPLDRERWTSLQPGARRSVAAQLRATLDELHAISPAALPDPLDDLHEDWIRSSIETCAAMSPRHPLGFDPDSLLARFEAAWSLGPVDRVVIHVDLKPPNLLIDGDRAAILDFGAVSLGDPAVDHGVLAHHLGDDVLEAMGVDGTPLGARARCFADLYHLRRCTRGWTRSAPIWSMP